MNKSQIGRLALRQEGENWNAYYAENNSMQNAFFLGSIKMIFIVKNEKRKLQFIELMREVVSDIIEEATDVRPHWGGLERAPESERSGNA